ncbi:unnamed protein product [Peronospora effusa]|nr:unnamed protein product [Peronospora effusa]
MPRAPPTTTRVARPRQVPTDSLLAASEAELASANYDALRANALKLAPTPAAPSDLHQMWIPCPTTVRKKHLSDLLDELATDSQPQVWKDARQARLLQDFLIIPNAGIRFTCASYDMASKLSQVSLTAFGSTIQIARFSKFGSRYYVDLVRLPAEVTDRMIFDWFASHDAPPTCVLPTYVRNGLPSRDRTVYFAQNTAPDVLVSTPSAPLREIHFPSPDDGMVTLSPCFINHKVARYNRVTPPSIRQRQASRATPPAAPSSTVANPSPESPSGDRQSHYESSLRQAIPTSTWDVASPTGSGDEVVQDMPVADIPPALDFDDSDADSVSSQQELEQILKEKINTPTFPSTAPIWAKAATNRLALLGKAGTEFVETHPLSFDFDQATGVAHATDLVKLNYYSPLWLDDPDTDHPKWHYDLELRHAEDAEACVESTPLRPNHEDYQHRIQPSTAVYDVEVMERTDLFIYIDKFLSNVSQSCPMDQLASIEANPGLLLKALETPASLDKLAVTRASCRLLASTPPSQQTEYLACLRLLETSGRGKSILKKLLRRSPHASSKPALLVLSKWDVVIHIMAPTVYHDALKLFVLLDDSPRFFVNLAIPLLTDETLWRLGFSSFAMELLQYDRAPDFLKTRN